MTEDKINNQESGYSPEWKEGILKVNEITGEINIVGGDRPKANYDCDYYVTDLLKKHWHVRFGVLPKKVKNIKDITMKVSNLIEEQEKKEENNKNIPDLVLQAKAAKEALCRVLEYLNN